MLKEQRKQINDLVDRLRKRAEIRRNIPHRKSVQNNEPDRISDILEEAADMIEFLASDRYMVNQSPSEAFERLVKNYETVYQHAYGKKSETAQYDIMNVRELINKYDTE